VGKGEISWKMEEGKIRKRGKENGEGRSWMEGRERKVGGRDGRANKNVPPHHSANSMNDSRDLNVPTLLFESTVQQCIRRPVTDCIHNNNNNNNTKFVKRRVAVID